MTAERRASVTRETKETEVRVELDLDGQGRVEVETGLGMLDHLVAQLGKHAVFDLTLRCQGDLSVDAHHTVEDVGLVLGQALREALGDGAGLVRMADALVPLDEALASVAVDVSGRGYAVLEASWTGERIGELPATLIGHLLWSLASEARVTVYARVLRGVDDHHKAEALFKALGRALGAATRLDPRLAGDVPSTKGTLRA